MNQIVRNGGILISSHFCSLVGKDKCMQPWLNAVRQSDFINPHVSLLMCANLEVWIRYYVRWAQAGLE